KIPFEEMAVVSRTADRLLHPLPPLLKEWKIPFQSSARPTLESYPQVELGLELFSLSSAEGAVRFSHDHQNVPDLELKRIGVDSDHVWLWPEEGTWVDFITRATDRLDRYLKPQSPEGLSIWGTLRQGLASLANFGLIKSQVARDEFL